MKLIKVQVQDLFGIFNHPITLHPKGITLVLGQNGFGKTVILKMITAFFEGNFSEINSYDFSSFSLSFDTGNEIFIKRNEVDLTVFLISKNGENKSFKPLEDRYLTTDPTPLSTWFFKGANKYGHNKFEEYLPPHIQRAGKNIWFDERSQKVYSDASIIRMYRKHIPSNVLLPNELPEWLTDHIYAYKIKFIETQRLLNLLKVKEASSTASVTRFSQEIVDKIKNIQAVANSLSTNLDRTFPTRLINRINIKKKHNRKVLLDNLNLLEEKRKLLTSVGLIESDESSFELHKLYGGEGDVLNSVIEIYIEDSNDKIEVYLKFARKLKLFLDIINKRFSYKQISVHKDSGFIINSNKDYQVPLTSLSSGEQHELVLFYELLFNTDENCLLLIDEPEISFHIVWQHEFMSDLKEVVQINPMQVIIATHSPDIINKDWDLTIQLKSPN